MKSETIEKFYEIIGILQAFGNYLILFFFVIKPFKIKIKPYNYIFINTLICTLFDLFAIVLHNTTTEEFYYAIILPFYAINNILFMGFFLSYFFQNPTQKHFKFVAKGLSIIVLLIYIINGPTWSAIGSLFQSITIISFSIFTLNQFYSTTKKISNRNSALLIIFSLLFVNFSSTLINLFFTSMMKTSVSMAHLFYGIKNTFWFITNLSFAFAIYRIKNMR